MTMGVDATKPSIGVKGKQTRLSTSCPKKQGAHPSTKERPKQPRGSTRQSMAADYRESSGIVLDTVGQF